MKFVNMFWWFFFRKFGFGELLLCMCYGIDRLLFWSEMVFLDMDFRELLVIVIVWFLFRYWVWIMNFIMCCRVYRKFMMYFVIELIFSYGLKVWLKSWYCGKFYGLYVIDLIYIMYLYLIMLLLLLILLFKEIFFVLSV